MILKDDKRVWVWACGESEIGSFFITVVRFGIKQWEE